MDTSTIQFNFKCNSGVRVSKWNLLRLLEKQNALHFTLFSIFFFSSTTLPEYRKIRSKKIFYRLSINGYNLVICAKKGNFFWFILFPNELQHRGIPQRLLDECSPPVWDDDSRTKTSCCNILLWESLYFLQVNQQKCVGMISIKNK